MKYLLILFLAAHAALAQTRTGSISGTVLDSVTLNPIPAAWVSANRTGVPPFTKNTKTGSDGAFQIEGLTDGNFSLCVQVTSDQYLNPCQWNGNPTTVTLRPTQAVSGLLVKLTAASILKIQVKDSQKVLSQQTKDGRHPELSIGVQGPNRMYYPAHRTGTQTGTGTLSGAINSYTYQLAVPRDTPLSLHVVSRDLTLGDSNGVALPTNASHQMFQYASSDTDLKSFTFSVLGLLP